MPPVSGAIKGAFDNVGNAFGRIPELERDFYNKMSDLGHNIAEGLAKHKREAVLLGCVALLGTGAFIHDKLDNNTAPATVESPLGKEQQKENNSVTSLDILDKDVIANADSGKERDLNVVGPNPVGPAIADTITKERAQKGDRAVRASEIDRHFYDNPQILKAYDEYFLKKNNGDTKWIDNIKAKKPILNKELIDNAEEQKSVTRQIFARMQAGAIEQPLFNNTYMYKDGQIKPVTGMTFQVGHQVLYFDNVEGIQMPDDFIQTKALVTKDGKTTEETITIIADGLCIQAAEKPEEKKEVTPTVTATPGQPQDTPKRFPTPTASTNPTPTKLSEKKDNNVKVPGPDNTKNTFPTKVPNSGMSEAEFERTTSTPRPEIQAPTSAPASGNTTPAQDNTAPTAESYNANEGQTNPQPGNNTQPKPEEIAG